MNDKVTVSLNMSPETLKVIKDFICSLGIREISIDDADELYYTIIKAAEVKE